jgi:cytochrome c peroxidase
LRIKKLNQTLKSLTKSKLLLPTAVLLAAILTAILLWPTEKQSSLAVPESVLMQVEPVFSFTQPLPEHLQLDSQKVELGAKLFIDARLSADDTISCASCHNLATGGVDNQVRSIGVKGGRGKTNAPTVFNSGFNFVQFWDGRAQTLEEQLDGPVNDKNEMGSNWSQVIEKLSKDTIYPAQFAQSYSDGITESNIKNALATFERSLITPNSRFDKFLRGNQSVLNSQEKRGYELFQSLGCSSCHQGVNLGGNMFEKMGLMGDYFADRGHPEEVDSGRFNVDHNPESMHEFRVPALRNVALTAPYFHDGSAATLEQAIVVMSKYQLGRLISQPEIEAISAFLRSLTGEYQGKPL